MIVHLSYKLQKKSDIFMDFVTELGMRLYLSPKASSRRKCDIFWCLLSVGRRKGANNFFLFSSIFYSNRRVVHSAISCSSKKPYYYFLYTHIIFFFFLLHHFLESIYFWQIYDILLRAIEFFCVKGSPTKVIYQKKTRENDEKSLLDFRVCFRSIVFSWCWQFKSARSFC